MLGTVAIRENVGFSLDFELAAGIKTTVGIHKLTCTQLNLRQNHCQAHLFFFFTKKRKGRRKNPPCYLNPLPSIVEPYPTYAFFRIVAFSLSQY